MSEYKVFSINRKYKDRLFVLLFGSEEHKGNILSLYNALNGTSYTDSNDISIETMQDAIYIRMKNDVSLLLHDALNLWEQQSTYNPNMPLRGLMYFSNLYEKIVAADPKSIYGGSLIQIPTPKYYVLYNGKDKKPEREKLRLSDAFKKKDDVPSGDFEWTAEVLNINPGYNTWLMEKCPVLSEYMTLVSSIQEKISSGLPIEDAVDAAIQECIEKNVLADFLRKHRAEVRDVCLTEFDEEKFVRTMKAEGVKEGVEQNKIETAKAMLREHLSIETIEKCTGLSFSEIQTLTE